MSTWRTARLAGTFTMGKPIDRSMSEELDIPDDAVDDGEELYRAGGAIEQLNIAQAISSLCTPVPKATLHPASLCSVGFVVRPI